MQKLFWAGVLCLQLGLWAGADQLYIRNRPFKGEVVRESGKTWVGLTALAEALGLKLTGDPQQGYVLAVDGEASPPGEGKANVHGSEIPTLPGASGLLVALEDACPLLGARMVANKSLGTVDVSLVPATNSKAVPNSTSLLGSSAYTLVEYGVPGQAISDRVKPVFASARGEFKNVE